MMRFEYKVLPAPAKGLKAKGARTTEARFAHALMELMNTLGQDGWEYQRTDTLPCEERVGLTGRATRFQNMLVFRRALAVEAEAETRVAVVPFLRTASDARAVVTEPEPAVSEAEAEAEAILANALADADEGDPNGEETRESVADRLAATLSFGNREPRVPKLSPAAEPGNAPKLGGAVGNGLAHAGRHS
jgi:hypothetical protein